MKRVFCVLMFWLLIIPILLLRQLRRIKYFLINYVFFFLYFFTKHRFCHSLRNVLIILHHLDFWRCVSLDTELAQCDLITKTGFMIGRLPKLPTAVGQVHIFYAFNEISFGN